MAFELPDLPYAHDALAARHEPKETLEYHHDLHHKAYVDNGNKLIDGTEWAGKSLEEIITGTYGRRWRRTASSTTPPSIGTTTSSGK
jgi:Fe-Mn family superoxide dismutase